MNDLRAYLMNAVVFTPLWGMWAAWGGVGESCNHARKTKRPFFITNKKTAEERFPLRRFYAYMVLDTRFNRNAKFKNITVSACTVGVAVNLRFDLKNAIGCNGIRKHGYDIIGSNNGVIIKNHAA